MSKKETAVAWLTLGLAVVWRRLIEKKAAKKAAELLPGAVLDVLGAAVQGNRDAIPEDAARLIDEMQRAQFDRAMRELAEASAKAAASVEEALAKNEKLAAKARPRRK